VETTGINPYSSRLIEVGMTLFTFDRNEDEYQTLINPCTRIPEQVSAIHGITDDMVEDAPVIEDVIDDIISFIGDRPLVIHNSRFDLSFLEMECRRTERDIPRWAAFDTVALSRKTFPDMPNHKLDTLCRLFGISLSHHRALADARGCMDVFRQCVAAADPSRHWSMRQLCEYQSRIERSGIIQEVPFKERLGTVISLGKPVVITYIDSEGNSTERKILPKKIFKKGKQTVIYAYCYLRDEDRIFNTSRIESVKTV
jgi:DNA polymerase III epsilon subunit family exonuclease